MLADQLEDPGVRERLRRFLVEWRIGAAEADAPEVPPECRPACEAELERYRRALELLDAAGGDPLRPFREAEREGRVALAASSATHAVLPMLATPARGCACRSTPASARTAAASAGTAASGCPSAPMSPASSGASPSTACAGSASTRAPTARRSTRSTPVATEAGPVALPIDWEAVSWLWSLDGYPSDPAHAQFAGKSLRGIRLWKVGGGAYDPAAAAAAARRQAREFLAAVAARLREFGAERGERGLLVFAVDTELLGHWWSEGTIWLEEVIAAAAAAGVRLTHGAAGARRARARARAPASPRPGARPRTCAPGTRRRSPTSPGPRAGSSCACSARSPPACREAAATRAARELLAVQASDWAFLDGRGEAGDYAFQRATAHAEAAFEAIESPASTDPRMRSLAPDLSLAPLMAP